MFFKKVYNFPMGNKFRAKMSKARFEIGDHENHATDEKITSPV